MWSARTLCRVLFASSELVLAKLHQGAECRVLGVDNAMTQGLIMGGNLHKGNGHTSKW